MGLEAVIILGFYVQRDGITPLQVVLLCACINAQRLPSPPTNISPRIPATAHCLLRSSPSSCLTCRPLQAGNITKSDQILPYFATNELPHGVSEDKGAKEVAMRCIYNEASQTCCAKQCFLLAHNIPCT